MAGVADNLAPAATPAMPVGAATLTGPAGAPPLSDGELVAACCRTGDPATFEQLVLRHLPAVRRVLTRIVLSPTDADDLTQETFLTAYRQLADFRAEATFSTWLHRIAVNQAFMFLRHRRARHEVVALDEPLGPVGLQPDRQVLQREESARLEAAVARLEPQTRAVLILATVEQVDVPTIAQILACPRATVYWRLHRARRQVAAWLRTDGHEFPAGAGAGSES